MGFSKSLWLIVLLGLVAALPAQHITGELQEMIQTGKEQIYQFHLDKALNTFRLVEQKFPQYPHGFFYESYITAILYSQDETNAVLDSTLMQSVKQAIKVGEAYKEKTKNSADALYYVGVSYGVLGIYHVLNRNYVKGYIYGHRGKNYLEDVVREDSTYYDAYLGLGIFHYYVDLLPGLTKFFAKILGFSGNRLLGMQEIASTAQKGQFFKVEARFVQAVFGYFLEGDEQAALGTFYRMHNQYPGNPAPTLLLGYHYRRHGDVENAITVFSSVPDDYAGKLPEITVMKYYNLGVCYFLKNDFRRAEEHFNYLMDHKIRKSLYYLAALEYYKGLLADLQFDRPLADRYLRMITKNKDTQYWFNISRMHAKYPMDSLMYRFIVLDNRVFTSRKPTSLAEPVDQLWADVESRDGENACPDLIFLSRDLQAVVRYKLGKFRESAEIYSGLIEKLGKMEDEFQRAWIFIHYAQVLRELKNWDEASEMLDKAGSTNDEYTQLILTRERFMLIQRKKQFKT